MKKTLTKQKIYSVKIAGMAGQGIKSSGILFARFAARSGCYIFNYIEYPSIIRGGHNVMQINISKEKVEGPSNKTDLLVALNQDGIDFHLDSLTDGAGIIYDGDKKIDVSKVPAGINLYPVNLSAFAKESGGDELLINSVALGAITGMLGGNIEILKAFVREEYAGKSEEIINADLKAAELGYKYAKENYDSKVVDILNSVQGYPNGKPLMVVNGNEAAGMGAIAGGVQFIAIYPMSPISNILHFLTSYQQKYGFVYKQPEDEISAINMAIGASFAGARSMTSTSGGGFALMSEAYGLAGIAEVGVVIVEGQRGAPATGLPTWSEQGDLRFVLHAHQGDFPRIVLTPGDIEEVFDLTRKAFNLAEKYQTPVVVLIDKNLCEHDKTVEVFDNSNFVVNRGKLSLDLDPEFKRYNLSEDGISTRTVPGVGNFFIANSDEHDEKGYSSEEIDNRNEQMKKRMQKLITCEREDMDQPVLYGPENADITIVSWGSNKGSILQAINEFENVNYLHLTWANPFPAKRIFEVLSKTKHVINIEANYTGHMAGIIREKTGFEIKDNFLKYDGRPFFVEEIIEKINSVLKGEEK